VQRRARQFADRSRCARFAQHAPQGYCVTKEIVVNVQGYGKEDLSDNLMKKMRDYGWTVKVTKLEMLKKV
jgi:hypothetical protein